MFIETWLSRGVYQV